MHRGGDVVDVLLSRAPELLAMGRTAYVASQLATVSFPKKLI